MFCLIYIVDLTWLRWRFCKYTDIQTQSWLAHTWNEEKKLTYRGHLHIKIYPGLHIFCFVNIGRSAISTIFSWFCQPCYESIVPVALRVEVDVVTASILMCCCCRSCWRCCRNCCWCCRCCWWSCRSCWCRRWCCRSCSWCRCRSCWVISGTCMLENGS